MIHFKFSVNQYDHSLISVTGFSFITGSESHAKSATLGQVVSHASEYNKNSEKNQRRNNQIFFRFNIFCFLYVKSYRLIIVRIAINANFY